MALMPVVRARQPGDQDQVPWVPLTVAGFVVVFLVLLGTGHIRIAPGISSAAPAKAPSESNPALRWADHPPSLVLPGQLPHWLGVSARPPGSRQLEDGPLLNDTVRCWEGWGLGGSQQVHASALTGTLTSTQPRAVCCTALAPAGAVQLPSARRRCLAVPQPVLRKAQGLFRGGWSRRRRRREPLAGSSCRLAWHVD